MKFKKEHKTKIIYKDMFKRYDIELKLVRIKKSSYDGGILYDCISEKEYGGLTNWTLQPHEIQSWK